MTPIAAELGGCPEYIIRHSPEDPCPNGGHAYLVTLRGDACLYTFVIPKALSEDHAVSLMRKQAVNFIQFLRCIASDEDKVPTSFVDPQDIDKHEEAKKTRRRKMSTLLRQVEQIHSHIDELVQKTVSDGVYRSYNVRTLHAQAGSKQAEYDHLNDSPVPEVQVQVRTPIKMDTAKWEKVVRWIDEGNASADILDATRAYVAAYFDDNRGECSYLENVRVHPDTDLVTRIADAD